MALTFNLGALAGFGISELVRHLMVYNIEPTGDIDYDRYLLARQLYSSAYINTYYPQLIPLGYRNSVYSISDVWSLSPTSLSFSLTVSLLRHQWNQIHPHLGQLAPNHPVEIQLEKTALTPVEQYDHP
jgi:hypothetical protein